MKNNIQEPGTIITNFEPDFENNHSNNVIWLNEINEKTAKDATLKILTLNSNSNQQLIPIYIDSVGGDVDALFTILNVMQVCAKPIATIAIGKAMSAGAILLSQGTPGLRFAGKYSRLMMHELTSGTWGKMKDINASTDDLKKVNNIILELFAKRTKFKSLERLVEFFNKRGNVDWNISAEEALECELIDSINIPFIVPIEPVERFELVTVDPNTQQNTNREFKSKFKEFVHVKESLDSTKKLKNKKNSK